MPLPKNRVPISSIKLRHHEKIVGISPTYDVNPDNGETERLFKVYIGRRERNGTYSYRVIFLYEEDWENMPGLAETFDECFKVQDKLRDAIKVSFVGKRFDS